jgi:hypothetical protein
MHPPKPPSILSIITTENVTIVQRIPYRMANIISFTHTNAAMTTSASQAQTVKHSDTVEHSPPPPLVGIE